MIDDVVGAEHMVVGNIEGVEEVLEPIEEVGWTGMWPRQGTKAEVALRGSYRGSISLNLRY